MKTVSAQSTRMVAEHLPEVHIAAQIRSASIRVMYNMRGYGFTEDKIYYSTAVKEMDALEKALENARWLEEKAMLRVKSWIGWEHR